jgi:hypothetical protein
LHRHKWPACLSKVPHFCSWESCVLHGRFWARDIKMSLLKESLSSGHVHCWKADSILSVNRFWRVALKDNLRTLLVREFMSRSFMGEISFSPMHFGKAQWGAQRRQDAV